jgi:RHS repeat-associated protein
MSALQAAPKRYRYTGKERDEETSLSYHGARYYAPWLARWTSCDPALLADGPNLYQYVRSRPIVYSDPGGTNGGLPKVEPIREGMIIGDYPGLSSRWKQATEKVLKRVYGGGTYEENLVRFQADIARMPHGSNTQKGTAVNFARRVFNSINAQFKKLVTLPAGTQVHHALPGEGVAGNPGKAIDPSHLEIATGQAAVPGSTHWRAHEANRLADQGVANPGREATQRMEAARGNAPPSEPPPKPAGEPPPKPGAAEAPAAPPSEPAPKAAPAADPAPPPPAAKPAPPPEPPAAPPAAPPEGAPPKVAPGEPPGVAPAEAPVGMLGKFGNVVRVAMPYANAALVGYVFITRGPKGVSEMVEETIALPFVVSYAMGKGAPKVVESRKPGCAKTDSCPNVFMGKR